MMQLEFGIMRKDFIIDVNRYIYIHIHTYIYIYIFNKLGYRKYILYIYILIEYI